MARTKKKTWTPGSIEPLNGKCYFVHDKSRMTRVWDMGTLPVPEKQGWRQVTLDDYLAFRRETLTIPLKRRKATHATLYEAKLCESKQASPTPSTSTPPKAAASNTSGRKRSVKSTNATARTMAKAPRKTK